MSFVQELVAIGILADKLYYAVGRTQRNRRRLNTLLKRVVWFAKQFKQLEQQQQNQLQASDLRIVSDFKTLLTELLEFVEKQDQKGWIRRTWGHRSTHDRIDEFYEILQNQRDDLVFLFMKNLQNSLVLPPKEEFDETLNADRRQDLKDILQEIQNKSNLSTVDDGNDSSSSSLTTAALVSTITTQIGARDEAVVLRELRPHHFEPNLLELGSQQQSLMIVGQGASGIIYKVKWLTRNEYVAVKVLRGNLPRNTEQELRNEVTIMSSLRNENILTVHGLFVAPNCLCLVMEYAEGGSLRSYLGNGKILSNWERWSFAHQIANGMNWLHSSDPPIIHRDLKSDNILLSGDHKKILIADFGTAIVRWQTTTTSFESIPSDSTSGSHQGVAGSLPWMPPEAFSDSKQSRPGDVYAFGMVLWEMATNATPWAEVNPSVIPERVKSGIRPQIDNPSAYEPTYLELMNNCWATDPKIRPTFMQIKSICEPHLGIVAFGDEPIENFQLPVEQVDENKQQVDKRPTYLVCLATYSCCWKITKTGLMVAGISVGFVILAAAIAIGVVVSSSNASPPSSTNSTKIPTFSPSIISSTLIPTTASPFSTSNTQQPTPSSKTLQPTPIKTDQPTPITTTPPTTIRPTLRPTNSPTIKTLTPTTLAPLSSSSPTAVTNTPQSSPTSFQFFVTPLSWENAESACQVIDSHLATIRTDSDRNRFLTQALARFPLLQDKNPTTSIWIGLNNINSSTPGNKNSWKWTSGAPFNFNSFSWRPNQPDNTNKQHCVGYRCLNTVCSPVFDNELCKSLNVYACDPP